MYDIIGDVHGHAPLLKKLLSKLGYVKKAGVYSHSSRKAVFVGDFINRGPEIRKTIRIIRSMVENNKALAVLGNHELNAIIYGLKDNKGAPLIKRPGKHFLSLFKTINEFSDYPAEWKSHLKWMRTLPFALELGKIRVVHACWDESALKKINAKIIDGKVKKSTFRKVQLEPDSGIAKSFWQVTKGINMKIPSDIRIINNKGVWIRSFRLRWWEDAGGKTFEEMSFESKYSFPAYTIPEQIVPGTLPYSGDLPLLFFGHYCQSKGPNIIKPNICCVDSCVTGSHSLMAYRWDGEQKLKDENLIKVKR